MRPLAALREPWLGGEAATRQICAIEPSQSVRCHPELFQRPSSTDLLLDIFKPKPDFFAWLFGRYDVGEATVTNVGIFMQENRTDYRLGGWMCGLALRVGLHLEAADPRRTEEMMTASVP